MNDLLYCLGPGVITGILFLIFLLSWHVSFWFGSSRRETDGDAQGLAIEASILTLFALLLGFTFSMAANRYEVRKEVALQEANAIGTAYLRADLLPAASRDVLRNTLKGYLEARLEFSQAPYNSPALQSANEKADRLQSEAWKVAAEEGRANATPSSALLLIALNEVIDVREKRKVVLENTIPETILWFLFVISSLMITVIGYMNGVHKKKQLPLSILFCVVVALTLFLVLDLDRPRRGLIRLNNESLLRLQQSLRN